MKNEKRVNPWLLAMKPPSLLKVFLPLLVGWSLAIAEAREILLYHTLFLALFGLAMQLFIVFMNDSADAEADRVHAKEFPEHIDPRVIPLKLLSSRALLIAGVVAGVVALGTGGVLSFLYDRTLALPLIAGALFLLYAYSFPPFKVNYRGGGELLETAGVGAMLPLIGYYVMSGSLDVRFPLFIPVVLVAFASAISSGLKHLPADRVTGKKTVAVLFGTKTAITLIMLALFSGIAVTGVFIATSRYHVYALAAVVLPLFFGIHALFDAPHANYRQLFPLKRFKMNVHFAVYFTSLGIALAYAIPFLFPNLPFA